MLRVLGFGFRVSGFESGVSTDPEALDEGEVEGDKEVLRQAGNLTVCTGIDLWKMLPLAVY